MVGNVGEVDVVGLRIDEVDGAAGAWTLGGVSIYGGASGNPGAAGAIPGGGEGSNALGARGQIDVTTFNYLLKRDLDPAANDNSPMWLAAVA